MTTENEIKQILLSTGRNGIEHIVDYLCKNNFFYLPASLKYQNQECGGLANHSLATYKFAMLIYNHLSNKNFDIKKLISVESIAIVSLLHDVCKIDNYRIINTLPNGIPVFGTKKNYLPCGHGEKSVIMLLCEGLELTRDEILAIRWHMGIYEQPQNPNSQTHKAYKEAMVMTPLCKIVQQADYTATQQNLNPDFKLVLE